ncbi:hypothetical protein PMW_104 [Pseudomonas phage phiPMW]|uniref:Lipoprotein n=1 Tax=Pseudomonas phage phiPMW TaxID=1815582 RepID=A0A1S5R1G5_9CAUD|nr:hypothetical protein FDG97_gp104 [Pseudomonas phage phiPMW]ANA49229.1 hypothetical protein PMW_104 [Pseudomonas phage phiPMW]
MKLAKLALAVTLGSVLVGCEEPQPTQADLDSHAREVLNKDDAELKQALKEAQAKDPTIKDMYYTVDENGEKQMVIVRETVDPKTGQSSFSDSVLPMLGGMAAGALIASMFNSSGGYNRGYAPAPRSYYSQSDYRRKKNASVSAYAGSVRSRAATTIKSSPTWKATSASRSSGAFAGSGSARSSGYSSGG